MREQLHGSYCLGGTDPFTILQHASYCDTNFWAVAKVL
jgi:hypothetical protein